MAALTDFQAKIFKNMNEQIEDEEYFFGLRANFKH